MFELIARILETFWDVIPRHYMVGPTERGVAFVAGVWGRELKPGWYVHWPIIESIDSYSVVPRLVETAILTADDAEGRTWQVRLVVEYEIAQPLRYHLCQEDGQLNVEQAAGSSAIIALGRLPTDRVNRSALPLCQWITRHIAQHLQTRGVRIHKIRPVMWSRCRPIFLSQAERLAE